MKKMKKLFAVLLTLAMVMGMSLTTFAAKKESATIKVNGADSATLSYAQVIVPDQTTVTGWAFVDGVAAYYTAAFGVSDAQVAIQMMIDNTFTGTQMDKALSDVAKNVTFAPMANPQTVTVAGVYAVKAEEAKFSYKPMAAYVGFGEVVDDAGEVTYEYPSLLDTELNAKKSSIDLTKSVADDDFVTQIGKTLTFTVTTKVPYIPYNATNRSFTVVDAIQGAEYDLTDATVTMDGEPVDAEFVEGDSSFTVDLSALVNADNTNAGKDIVITYKAVVTDLTVNNRAANNVSGTEIDFSETSLVTGSLQLTKVDNTDAKNPLANAEFELLDAQGVALKFTKVGDDYIYNENGETKLVSDEEGLIVVKGLDVGTYKFSETKAPEGYKLVEEDKEATITKDALSASVEFVNTKLSALPSTGGIGTAVFTIGGCAIMVAAAYFFLASRKKES